MIELAVLRDLMDRRIALEHLAPYVIAGQPPPNDTGRAGRRVIASERTTTTRTLAEEAAFFAGRPVAQSPSRRTASEPEDEGGAA